jgi:hypothetical protein
MDTVPMAYQRIRKEEQKREQERVDREAEFNQRAEEIRQAFKSMASNFARQRRH